MAKPKSKKKVKSGIKKNPRKPARFNSKLKKSEKLKCVLKLILISILVASLIFFLFRFMTSITGNSVVSDTLESDFVLNGIKPVFDTLLGESGENQILLVRIMFLLLTFFISSTILKMTLFSNRQDTFARISLGIILAILLTRWIVNQELVENVLMSYNATGMALLTLVPFAISFYIFTFKFRGVRYRVFRKFGWIILTVYCAVIWFIAYNGKDLGNYGPLKWVYPIVAILAFLLFLMDNTIQSYFKKERAQNIIESQLLEQEEKYLEQIADERIKLNKKVITPEEFDKKVKEIQQSISNLHRN
ncbi:MAG TPA: hypothetical protein PLK34_01275 [Candidatus Pacearchaeota archaeon]|nr:hypothetical protein [Candidatus Pacearchaeota archaeon]